MIEGILIGLTTALTFQNIFMVMIGCFFGTIIGMLPGLGPMTAIALICLLYTSPSPRDYAASRMPSSA